MSGLLAVAVVLFFFLGLGPVLALLIQRRARRPGSTAWKVAQAGLKALPGAAALGIGAILAAVAFAYFGFLLLYWLFDTVLQTIWVSLINGFTGHHDTVHYGAYGQIALRGGGFFAAGLVVAGVGALLILVVGGFAVKSATAEQTAPPA